MYEDDDDDANVVVVVAFFPVSVYFFGCLRLSLSLLLYHSQQFVYSVDICIYSMYIERASLLSSVFHCRIIVADAATAA